MRKPTMKMFVSLIFVLFTALGVDAGAKLKPRASTTSAVAHSTPDDPTQTGTISTCNKWYDVVLGDTCASVEAAFGITSAQFLAWNVCILLAGRKLWNFMNPGSILNKPLLT